MKTLSVILLASCATSSVSAAWYNPFSWGSAEQTLPTVTLEALKQSPYWDLESVTNSECVDRVFSKLGLTKEPYTDPKIMQHVLKNVMFLDDMPKLKVLLNEELNGRMHIDTFLGKVKRGMTTLQYHPIIGKVACEVLKDKKLERVLFANVNMTLTNQVLHHSIMFEKIVREMVTSHEFTKEMLEFINKKVNALIGTDSPVTRFIKFLKTEAGWFGAVKDYSINKGMEGILEVREQGINSDDRINGPRFGVKVNIWEAMITDQLSSFGDNAKVGKRLASHEMETLGLTKSVTNSTLFHNDTKMANVRYGYKMDWARMYETWNLAFITGNVDNLHLLYPKLLIPSVLMTGGKDYLLARILALWLSIQFYLLNDLHKVPHLDLPGKTELAALWGKINLGYFDFLDAKEARGEQRKAIRDARAQSSVPAA